VDWKLTKDGGVDVEEPSVAANDGGRVQNVLDLREIDEQLHYQIYGVCKVTLEEDGMDLDERREVLSGWIGHIRGLSFLTRMYGQKI
jgi:hypothetical protein